jgi:hypothetical protein
MQTTPDRCAILLAMVVMDVFVVPIHIVPTIVDTLPPSSHCIHLNMNVLCWMPLLRKEEVAGNALFGCQRCLKMEDIGRSGRLGHWRPRSLPHWQCHLQHPFACTIYAFYYRNLSFFIRTFSICVLSILAYVVIIPSYVLTIPAQVVMIPSHVCTTCIHMWAWWSLC